MGLWSCKIGTQWYCVYMEGALETEEGPDLGGDEAVSEERRVRGLVAPDPSEGSG